MTCNSNLIPFLSPFHACLDQGKWLMDLSGTGLRVSLNAEWVTSSAATSLHLVISPDRERVEGTCSTHAGCGVCKPKIHKAIPVEVKVTR